MIVSVASAEDTPRPNILFIMTDDLGYADVGFNGSPDIVTPKLDELADGGVVFSSAYVVHPFCGPSRMGLMSGRYPHEFGGPFNLPETKDGPSELGIPEGETLISTILQDAGYFTGLIGKWHLGTKPQYHPNQRGFEDFYGFLGGGHSYFPSDFGPKYKMQVEAGNTQIWDYLHPLEHNGNEVEETEYVTDGLSREACRFIRDAQGDERPFFLFLSYNAPHTPLEAKESDMAVFPDITDEKRRKFAGMVYSVDRGVGRIVETLKETGQYENTLIVFLSDNGGRLDQGGNNAPLKEGKGSVHEGGFRTPMLFHWPEGLEAGQRYDHPVTALDFYPTFAGLAGAEIPADKHLDGKDIWQPLLAGESARPGEMLYVLTHRGSLSEVGARQDQWKVVRKGVQPWKLFDVQKDPGENNDLSTSHPDLVKTMVSEMKKLSEQHTEPQWFHAKSAEDLWIEHNMPNYDKTFSLP